MNVPSIYDIVHIEFYIQDRFGTYLEKIGETRWDPWCRGLLSTFFVNFETKEIQGEGSKLWDPLKILDVTTDVDGPGKRFEKNWYQSKEDDNLSIFLPGDYSEDPSIRQGDFKFIATHLGPLQQLESSPYPTAAPFRKEWLGTTEIDAQAPLLF